MNEDILLYLIHKLNEKYTQVGKTHVQKFMYFLKKKGLVDFEYTLYHYGPYSVEVANLLDKLRWSGKIEMTWVIDQGYYIKARPGTLELEKEIKEKIDLIVNFLADDCNVKTGKELSLIATTLYFIDKCKNEKEILEAVQEVKPQFPLEEIGRSIRIVKKLYEA